MRPDISDRPEYNNHQYAKLRITEIEAIMDTEDLSDEEIAEFEKELSELRPYMTEADPSAANFRLVAKKDFQKLLDAESKLHPNQPVYGLKKDNLCAITLDYYVVNYLVGIGYSLTHEVEWRPAKRKTTNSGMPTPDTLITATKSLLESFIDNYTTDCLNRCMNMDMIRTEIAQSLSGFFKTGNLRHLGFGQFELDGNTISATTTRKLVIFNDMTGIIDIVLDVKNWDETFNDAVNEGVRAWHNSDDEYSIVITEHLAAAGYKFDILDPQNYEILTDYS